MSKITISGDTVRSKEEIETQLLSLIRSRISAIKSEVSEIKSEIKLLIEIVLFIFFRRESYVGLQIITIIVFVISFFAILGTIAEGFPIVTVVDGPEGTSHGIYTT